MEIRKFNDLLESEDGDLIFAGGDIADTSERSDYAYFQAIRTIFVTPPGDFKLFPSFGLDLDIYRGRRNNEETAMNIASAMRMAIKNNTRLYSFEIDIDPFPIGKSTIVFPVSIMTGMRTSRFFMAYDTAEFGIGLVDRIGKEDGLTVTRIIPPTFNSRA